MRPGAGPLVVWRHSPGRGTGAALSRGPTRAYGGRVRRFAWLIFYLVAVFLTGALLAPWVWKAAQELRAAFPGGFVDRALDHPFPRIVHRCLLITALAGLWPLSRALGMHSWAALGLTGRPWGPGLVRGLAWGALAFAVVVLVELLAGVRDLRPDLTPGALLRKLGEGMLAGVLVGLLEEVLFRGVVYGGLRPAWGVARAAVASAALYSTVHFLGRAAPVTEVDWSSGLASLTGLVARWNEWTDLAPRWWTLFSAGLLFAAAYQSTGHLSLAVGLHGSLVFWNKVRAGLTVGGAGESGVWVSEALAVAAVWLLLRKCVTSGPSGSEKFPSGT